MYLDSRDGEATVFKRNDILSTQPSQLALNGSFELFEIKRSSMQANIAYLYTWGGLGLCYTLMELDVSGSRQRTTFL